MSGHEQVDQLMRVRGLYARLYRLNFASLDDVAEDLLPSPADNPG